MAESSVVDLGEITLDALADLYAELKLLDDGGNRTKAGAAEAKDSEALPTSTTDSIIGIFSIDTATPTSLQSYCSDNCLEKKAALEQILDVVFFSAGSCPNLNFGALLREYILSPDDAASMKEFLRNTADVTVAAIQREFLFTVSELELLLGVVYANVDKGDLAQQYGAAEPVKFPELSNEIFEEMTAEFDRELAALQAQKRAEVAPKIESIDRSMEQKIAGMDAACDLLLDDLQDLTRNVEEYKKKVGTEDVVEINDVIADIDYFALATSDLKPAVVNADTAATAEFLTTTLADYAESHGIGEVLPRLPRNVPVTASPEVVAKYEYPALPPTDDLPLTREPCGELPPPAAGDYCLAKRGDEWVAAVFHQFNVAGQPVVRIGQVLLAVAREHVAYASPPSWVMQVGDRVIAPFERRDTVSGSTTMCWCSAIVAEQASKRRNNGRYLVFNEVGDAHYVKYRDVRCCWRNPKPASIWSDIANVSVREFLKQLIGNLPEKALVRLKPKGTVRIFGDNDVWKKCVVEEVDGVMVKLRLPEGRSHWFYRGDRRLEPIFEQHAQAGRSSIVRRQHSRFSGHVIEYVDEDSDSEEKLAEQFVDAEAISKKVPTARKKINISSRSPMVIRDTGFNTANAGTSYPPLRPKEVVETYVRSLDVKRNGSSPEDRPHSACEEACVAPNDHPHKYKNENPLLVPMVCGWQRIIEKKRALARRIIYVPPCDHRQLRHSKELQDFLVQTNCQLTIDLFDFDIDLDPFETIRVIDPYVEIADFTNGREAVHVQCVNALTQERPIFPHYEARRFTNDKTVDLDGAKDFTSGCNCTDNCADPRRCHCQQLTISQATPESKRRRGKYFGYRYRRLPEGHVSTGIYECNSNCKCDHRCPNRVVQQPMMTRLQLFRTLNKGWGVRALDDLPKGQFVCIYAGNVLSDQAANEAGRSGDNEYLDEYFADLDLILCAETQKEGYEGTVEDIENSSGSEEGDEVDANRKRRRTGTSSCDDEENDNSRSRSRSAQAVAGSSVSRPWLLSTYLGEERSVFILDAKLSGNIGRYLNHSCSPNIFVQNVFVDTQDMRLPWVAFFTSEMIKAGTELCWDYHYTPMDGRAVACHCGAPNCRKRLI